MSLFIESASTFGRDAIAAGKTLIATELRVAGFKSAQVHFASEATDAAIYIASIHTPRGVMELEVPLEMQHNASGSYAPLLPVCFGYDGIIEDFTPVKLQRFAFTYKKM